MSDRTEIPEVRRATPGGAAALAEPRAGARAMRPRLGFAGAGWIGRNRLEAIAASGLADVAAIYDPVADAAVKACAAAPGAEAVRRYEDLLRDDIDAVVIATPNALHAAQAIAAVNAGKAVFCQKPLGRNLAETREVVAAARAADRLLHVDLSYRFSAGMQRIHELITAGALGPIYAIEAVFHNAYGPDKPWFYDRELSGGGCLLDLGVHLVDLALWCLGYPEVDRAVGELSNRVPATEPARAVEDYAAAQLRFAGGTSMQLACSWKVPAGRDAQIGITFYGRDGGASFHNVDGSFYDFVAERFRLDRSREVLASPPDAWGGRAAVAWCRRLATSAAYDPATDHLNAVAATLDRLYGRAP